MLYWPYPSKLFLEMVSSLPANNATTRLAWRIKMRVKQLELPREQSIASPNLDLSRHF